jgi:ATP-dependent DNA ligase
MADTAQPPPAPHTDVLVHGGRIMTMDDASTVVDAVLMYAQRGHGKRSSFYSDFTFGCWRTGDSGDELVPVGKAYFGFTDAELAAEGERGLTHRSQQLVGVHRRQ